MRGGARVATLGLVCVATLACGSKKKAPAMQIVTETTSIRADQPLPSSSPIFDGEAIVLRGVRGETLGFVVAFDTAAARSLSVRNLGAQSGVAASLFNLEMVPVVEPSSALFGPSRGAGDYPDRVVPHQSSAASQQYLVELEIDANASAGARSASLDIDGRAIEIRLEVMAYSIKLDRGPLVWVWYDTREVKTLAEEIEHQKFLLAHGALFATDPPVDQLEVRRELFVPSASYWPVRIRSADPAELERNAAAMIEFFEPMPQTPFTIPLDEPANDAARERVVATGKVLRKAGAGPKRLLHAVTDRRRPIYGDSVDVFISLSGISDEMPRTQRRWTYNGRPPSAGNMTIDTRGGTLRSWGWIAFRYDVELWYAWNGTYYTDRYNVPSGAKMTPTDLTKSMVTFDQRRKGGEGDYGNGDGLLVYPGMIASLRLKALRRGLQDRLLLAKLRACGGAAAASEIALQTVPVALGDAGGVALWPADERGWELARDATLEAIARHCPAE